MKYSIIAVPYGRTRREEKNVRKSIQMSFVSLIFLLMLGSAAAYAQIMNEVVVNVPFKFTVENTTLPAGTYVISAPTSDPNVLEIRQEKGEISVLFLTDPVAPTQASVPKSELVFDRVGNRDFLRQVWEEGSDQGAEIQKSKQEAKLEQSANKAQQHRVAAKRRKRGK